MTEAGFTAAALCQRACQFSPQQVSPPHLNQTEYKPEGVVVRTLEHIISAQYTANYVNASERPLLLRPLAGLPTQKGLHRRFSQQLHRVPEHTSTMSMPSAPSACRQHGFESCQACFASAQLVARWGTSTPASDAAMRRYLQAPATQIERNHTLVESTHSLQS